MSVYSRCVDARGTTSIESTPASRHASKPVVRLAPRVRRLVGGPGRGAIDEPCCIQYGCTLKPYSDWTASAGTTGLTSLRPGKPPARRVQLVERDDGLHAVVDALHVRDRGRAERVADDRDARRAPGRGGPPVAAAVEQLPQRVEALTAVVAGAVRVRLRGVDRKKSARPACRRRSSSPAGRARRGSRTPRRPRGAANGLQNGSAFTWSFSCGSVSLVPWPCTS